ncbi:MAG TPA: iron-sulfur cluster assembly scaffold protein, partial [Anaerolineae bacterium]|nr:iron-sulfur cluster assembly scaffold protein [Anaerolineae bacterium]
QCMSWKRSDRDVHNDKVMDHFMNPRNVGSIEDASCIGNAGNPADGDTIRLYLKIEEERISDAKVKVFGCPTAIAAASALTELIVGKTIGEALAVRNEDVSKALGGLPEGKLHCSVLAEAVLQDAISQYRERD